MAKSENPGSKVQQVQIQILGPDGEWFAPHQFIAAVAALRAIREDIAQYSGTYSDDNLRKFREELDALDEQIGKRIGNLRKFRAEVRKLGEAR